MFAGPAQRNLRFAYEFVQALQEPCKHTEKKTSVGAARGHFSFRKKLEAGAKRRGPKGRGSRPETFPKRKIRAAPTGAAEILDFLKNEELGPGFRSVVTRTAESPCSSRYGPFLVASRKLCTGGELVLVSHSAAIIYHSLFFFTIFSPTIWQG